MSEIPYSSNLDQFRDAHFPFVYWLNNDQQLIKKVTNDIVSAGPFGLETGFGDQFSRLDLIDLSVPWILTESGSKEFQNARQNLHRYWEGIDTKALPQSFELFAVNTISNNKDLATVMASTLVYRNVDRSSIYIPHYVDLQKGQRLVFIVDGAHVDERLDYTDYLQSFGYKKSDFAFQPPNKPPLSLPLGRDFQTIILDIVKG